MKGLMIPKKNDWQGFENDLDLIEMYNMFYSKSIEVTYKYFSNGACIGRADELLRANQSIFQYYIYSYILYLLSSLGENDVEAKEVFLRLLISKEKRDTGSIVQIFNKIENLYYLDDEFNKHDFHISIEQMVEKIKIQYKNSEIDKWLYDELPELFLELDKLCTSN